MAYLYQKKNKYYYAIFSATERQPPQKWVPMRTKDKSAANARMVRLDRDYALGVYDPWTDKNKSKPTVEDACRLFLKSRDHCEAATRQHYSSVLSLFSRSLSPGFRVDHIETGDIKHFLRQGERSNATVRNYFRHIRAFFSWLEEEGYVDQNPVQGMKLKKEHKNLPKYLSQDQLDELLTVIKADHATNPYLGHNKTLWLPDVVEFACYTGLRLSEICRLQWRDLDLDMGHVQVRNSSSSTTKSGRERIVPLVGRALEVVANLTMGDDHDPVFVNGDGEHLKPDYVSRRFRKFRRMAGIPAEISFHSLRHTCASWLVMKGISLYKVSKVLGHSSITVTEQYAHLAPENMKEDMQRAFSL